MELNAAFRPGHDCSWSTVSRASVVGHPARVTAQKQGGGGGYGEWRWGSHWPWSKSGQQNSGYSNQHACVMKYSPPRWQIFICSFLKTFGLEQVPLMDFFWFWRGCLVCSTRGLSQPFSHDFSSTSNYYILYVFTSCHPGGLFLTWRVSHSIDGNDPALPLYEPASSPLFGLLLLQRCWGFFFFFWADYITKTLST